jgi:hypothetical protein
LTGGLVGGVARLDPAHRRDGGFVSSGLVGLSAPTLDSARGGGLVTSRLEILDGPVLDSARGGGLITPHSVGSHAPALESACMERGHVCGYRRPFLPTSSVANEKDRLSFCSEIVDARSPYRHLPSVSAIMSV